MTVVKQELFQAEVMKLICEVLADFVALANIAVQGNPDDTTASDFVGRHKVALLQVKRKQVDCLILFELNTYATPLFLSI
jgi:hypothetical protein